MGVFDPRQGQVLPSPVTNFYKGKAIRQELADAEQMTELRGLQIEQAKQEIEDAPLAKEAADRKAALEYANILSQIQKRQLEIGDAQMEQARSVLQPWLGMYSERAEKDESGAIAWANKTFPEVLKKLPQDRQEEFLQAAGPDRVLDPQELSLMGLGILAYEAEKPGTPTSHQKVLDDLVDRGYITEEERNQTLLDIEKKAGTVTGTTEFDPTARQDPRTDSQKGAAYQENLDRFTQSSTIQEMISAGLPRVSGLPGAVGFTGKAGVIGSGLLSTLGQDEMADQWSEWMSGASPEEISSVMAQLQSIRGELLPIVTGQESRARLSDQERQVGDKAVSLIDEIKGPADLAKSYPQVIGALKQFYEESWAKKYRVAQQDPNIDFPYDLSNREEGEELIAEFQAAGIDEKSILRALTRLSRIQGIEFE